MSLDDLLKFSDANGNETEFSGQFSYAISETDDGNENILNTLLRSSPPPITNTVPANGVDGDSWDESSTCSTVSDVHHTSTGGKVSFAEPSANTGLVKKPDIWKRLYHKAIPEETDLHHSISTFINESMKSAELQKEKQQQVDLHWKANRDRLARASTKRRAKRDADKNVSKNESVPYNNRKLDPIKDEQLFVTSGLAGIPEPPSVTKPKPKFKVNSVEDINIFKGYARGAPTPREKYRAPPKTIPQKVTQVPREAYEQPTRERTQRLYEDAQQREQMRIRTKFLSQKLNRTAKRREMDIIMGRL